MQLLTRKLTQKPAPTERILQFGTGNFLKGFVNDIVDEMNTQHDFDAGIVAVKLRPGNQQQIDRINAQDGLFTLNIRGVENGAIVDQCKLVSCQTRAINPYQDCDAFLATAAQEDLAWIISNTTEAGIHFDQNAALDDTPAMSFPAKLTQWLYARFQHFDGSDQHAVNVICCELIENNAVVLKDMLLRHATEWQLPVSFYTWLNDKCQFFNSLVDRIVPGRPSEDVCQVIQQTQGYRDDELLEAEPYCLWAIQVPNNQQAQFKKVFPTSNISSVVIADDLSYYRERKVRLLNGPHTATANLARLLKIETVYQATCNERIAAFMQDLMQQEIMPLLGGNLEELTTYAQDIYQRFANPFLKHEWRAISMNSLSKWRARLMPLVKAAEHQGRVPERLIASMVCLLCVYRNPEWVNDGDYQAPLFSSLASNNVEEVVTEILANKKLWGENLNTWPIFKSGVLHGLHRVLDQGIDTYLTELS